MNPWSLKSLFVLTIVIGMFQSSCATPIDTNYVLRPKNFNEQLTNVYVSDFSLNSFASEGQFKYFFHQNRTLPLDTKIPVLFDIYTPMSLKKAPLVIFLHGNKSRKEAHRYQARHLATWGFNAITLQMRNKNKWMTNAKVLFDVVNFIARNSSLISKKINPKKILLVGHSFGGSAVTVAAGLGAPIKGLILLDPAVVHKKVKKYMKKVKVPTILLGADKKVFRSRKRSQFYKYMGYEIAEVSIKGATHDDAQNPSMFSHYALGLDPYTSKQRQKYFSQAITAAAFSLMTRGGTSLAWRMFKTETKNGRMKNGRRNNKRKRLSRRR